MSIFYLKARDTRPVIDVYLLNPDGSAHDLTGSTSWFLHIRMMDGTRLKRTMTKFGADADGTLRYTWVATDWDAASVPDADGSFTVGGLVAGPTLPLTLGKVEAQMEYEVVGPGAARMTFPNGGHSTADAYDTLRIIGDVGQG